MKHYKKTYEDICHIDKWKSHEKTTKNVSGSLDELILRFRDFYSKSHRDLFRMIIEEIWLEQQLVFNGKRKVKRRAFGKWSTLSFGRFMKIAVGVSQRVLTSAFVFTPVSTYFMDFFPDFLINDPFKNPEKYEYPYKHVTLDQLVFVYQMDERLELLKESEEKSMTYAEFINWATNWALSNNLEIGKEKYTLKGGHFNWVYIHNSNLKPFWENKLFNFKTKKWKKQKKTIQSQD